jgi:hypothetical protein
MMMMRYTCELSVYSQFASETDVWLDERNKLDHSNQMTSILIQ